MFESIADKMQRALGGLARKGRLTEGDIDAALRQVRLALLEADVNYRVVGDLTDRVKARALDAQRTKSVAPADQVVVIVHEELVATLGEARPLSLDGQTPARILLAGLQGSGKTTTAAKLAHLVRRDGKRPLMVACDTRRPAAVEQLAALGTELGVEVYAEGVEASPPDIAARGLAHAAAGDYEVVIFDSGGRLQIDDALMTEIEEIARRVRPTETLLVVDAMTGQEAVNVAAAFHKGLGLTGLVLSKADGDARGGAALSVHAVTGVPVKFLGVGEKPGDLEAFHPDRLAGRILGMGDVATLAERIEATMDHGAARRAEQRLHSGAFDLEDFLTQLQQIKRMGPLQEILGLLPGFGAMRRQLPEGAGDGQLMRVEAIILSMTPGERRNPRLLNASRKRRIAKGSGTRVQDVNQLVRQFRQMQRMMKRLGQRTPHSLVG